MASMAIKNWRISIHDLTWMVHNNNLSLEEFSIHSWDVLSVRSNISSLDIRNSKTFNVETNIISRNGFFNLLMMHLDRFNISGSSDWTKSNSHVWLHDTS